MRKATIAPEMMMKVWKLHTNGVDERLIAETLGISYNSAQRIVKIMTAAQNGRDVDSVCGDGYQKQKNFAKKMFGIEEKKEEVKSDAQEEEQNSDDITKDFMQRVLLSLAWQNELLETLLHSLGVDWKTLCKGVERR